MGRYEDRGQESIACDAGDGFVNKLRPMRPSILLGIPHREQEDMPVWFKKQKNYYAQNSHSAGSKKTSPFFWFFCHEISTYFRTCMDERRPHENSSQSFLTFSLDAIHTCPHQNPKNYFCQGLSTSRSHRLHGGSFMVRCAAPQFLLRQWIPPMMWDKRSDRSSHLNISPFSASAP
jgi:hypothetical protein